MYDAACRDNKQFISELEKLYRKRGGVGWGWGWGGHPTTRSEEEEWEEKRKPERPGQRSTPLSLMSVVSFISSSSNQRRESPQRTGSLTELLSGRAAPSTDLQPITLHTAPLIEK
ncbi:hypothetical protein INR49_000117 [Caranx melampygus]|nr:hypothetical protein INR49_000117 [Caranx melampygus]